MQEERRFYVYEWFRIADNHVFYVGKGTGDRASKKSDASRNQYFMNYIRKYKCSFRIVQDNLTEHEAYVLENDLNQAYKQKEQCECNIADTSFCNGGPSLKGELNGMYGKTHTPETREYLRLVNLDGHNAGENNSQYGQYGVSPKDRMSKETYEQWRAKQRARKDGSLNPNSHFVLMIDVLTEEYQTFNSIIDCQHYLETISDFTERYDTLEKLRYLIKHSNKTNAIYFNKIFKIYKDEQLDIDNTVSSLIKNSRKIRKIPKYER